MSCYNNGCNKNECATLCDSGRCVRPLYPKQKNCCGDMDECIKPCLEQQICNLWRSSENYNGYRGDNFGFEYSQGYGDCRSRCARKCGRRCGGWGDNGFDGNNGFNGGFDGGFGGGCGRGCGIRCPKPCPWRCICPCTC